MADYLEDYAAHFNLPVRTGMKVDKLLREDGRFVVNAGDHRSRRKTWSWRWAVISRHGCHRLRGNLIRRFVQLHSLDYRNPAQLKDGGVLIVGVGNSGADIALEVARTHRTWLAGKESGHVPFRIETFAGRFIFVRIVRFIGHHVLTVATPIGRRLRPKLRFQAAPLIRVKPQDLVAAGIERVSRVSGVKNGRPVLEDGRVAGRGQRHLVYRILERILVDRSADFRGRRRADLRPRDRAERSWFVFRRSEFPVRDDVGHRVGSPTRREAGRRRDRGAHRFVKSSVGRDASATEAGTSCTVS